MDRYPRCRPRVVKTHPSNLHLLEARSSWPCEDREKRLSWQKSWYKSSAIWITYIWVHEQFEFMHHGSYSGFPGFPIFKPSFCVSVNCFVPWYLVRPALSLYFFTGLKLGFFFFNCCLKILVILPCQKKDINLELLQRHVRLGVGWS